MTVHLWHGPDVNQLQACQRKGQSSLATLRALALLGIRYDPEFFPHLLSLPVTDAFQESGKGLG